MLTVEELDELVGSAAYDVDELAHAAAIAKLDDARDFGEQRIVFAPADILAGLDRVPRCRTMMEPPSPLAAESLDAEPLRVRIAPVFRTA